MSLSRPVSPIKKKRRMGEDIDFFPLNSLPNEVISLVLSFLPIKSRLLARVNTRLNAIELESKYYVEKLRIIEHSIDRPIYQYLRSENDQHIIFSTNKVYSSDCIRRITRNVSIGSLSVELLGSEKFHRDVYNLINEFEEFEHLTLEFENCEVAKDIVSDSFILDMAKTSISVDNNSDGDICNNISPATLQQIYKNMIDGSTMRYFQFDINETLRKSFLDLIGITYQDGNISSNRDIEIYQEEADEESFFMHIYDRNLEICFRSYISDFEFESLFQMKLHATPESLEEAKNEVELVRIDINE